MPLDLELLSDVIAHAVREAVAPFKAQLALTEAKLLEFAGLQGALADLRERVAVAETKAAVVVPVVAPPEPAAWAERAAVAELTKDVGALRERVAVVEVRAQVPGPAGKDGEPGKDGRDGADGVGFDDMAVEFDGDRTLTVKATRGDRVKAWPIALPFMRQKGVYQDGEAYTTGDVVTWGGSQWHCSEPTTTKPGEGSKAWTLVVKRGRDGKDGKDAPGALPVVKVG